MSAIEDTYNGRPVLRLQNGTDDRYGFSFGVKKAKMIVDHLDAINAFIEKQAKAAAGAAK